MSCLHFAPLSSKLIQGLKQWLKWLQITPTKDYLLTGTELKSGRQPDTNLSMVFWQAQHTMSFLQSVLCDHYFSKQGCGAEHCAAMLGSMMKGSLLQCSTQYSAMVCSAVQCSAVRLLVVLWSSGPLNQPWKSSPLLPSLLLFRTTLGILMTC